MLAYGVSGVVTFLDEQDQLLWSHVDESEVTFDDLDGLLSVLINDSFKI